MHHSDALIKLFAPKNKTKKTNWAATTEMDVQGVWVQHSQGLETRVQLPPQLPILPFGYQSLLVTTYVIVSMPHPSTPTKAWKTGGLHWHKALSFTPSDWSNFRQLTEESWAL